MLAGIELLNVERDEAPALPLEQSPRSGSEVLQTGPDCQNHIRLGGELVGRRRSRHADGAHIERMTRRKGRFAGLRLAKGTPCCSQKDWKSCSASEYQTPPPAIANGLRA